MTAVYAVVARAVAVAKGRERGPGGGAPAGWVRPVDARARIGVEVVRGWAGADRGHDSAGQVGADRTDHRRGVLPDGARAADHPGSGARAVQPGDRGRAL